MFRIAFLLQFSLLAYSYASAQYNVNFQVNNKLNGEHLSFVSIVGKGNAVHIVTDSNGRAKAYLKGTSQLEISASGFETKEFVLNITADTSIIILMEQEDKEMEEVIISSTRTDSRIENTPTRVEVIGSEEVEEESGVKPSHIASLLGDVAGIQSQLTSPVTGNTDMRIQGLPGGYTQILRDGLPLFGGYAGGFSILQIPPLDLKQIEIIKGASSTLYGGGAIAGMINIIPRKPLLGKQERYLLLNQSTLHETNMNVFLSERDKKRGYTFFAGGNYQRPFDVNNDGFSDLPFTEMIVVHPTFFAYPNEKNSISVGLNSTFEEREGGDMVVLRNRRDVDHQFHILNRSYRNTLDASWERKMNKTDKLIIKGIGSWFYRNITSNNFGLKGKQQAWFTEASYVFKRIKHDVVAGLNVSGERFTKKLPDSASIPNYDRTTFGLFVQDDWRLNPKWTIETGLRTDLNSEFGSFFLPRISVLFKASSSLTSRLGGGLGYKIPTVFSSDIDERDYRIARFDAVSKIKAERSYGVNWDVNFKKKINRVRFTVNQSFFYTRINDPLVATSSPTAIVFRSAGQPITTKGIETWLQIGFAGLDAYLGYTLIDAQKKYDPLHPYLELTARNKFASVISYTFSPRLRACMESSYTGWQYLEDGSRSPGFPIFAGMVRYDIGHFSFVLNCENFFDYRQTRKESIIIPPYNNPSFKQIWAPIDGRVANLSMRIEF
jgi:outer membrane receptor for ferrienterochelin and colicins